MIVRKLADTDLERLVKHLCSLDTEDRRLRFGVSITDELIRSYVEKSFKDKNSQWFACTAKGKIISSCHVAIYNNEGELGCTVDKKYRGYGLAQEMFDRAVIYLRAHNVLEVYMHCLTENQAMRHIAKKHNMVIVSCDGETDAKIRVEPPTPLTMYRDAYLDRIALYDMVIRSPSDMYENWLDEWYARKNK